ncbi:mannose-1-phosphate guanylyltransferase [Thermotoga neapolitana]|uniref:mannose-1-phosphate guanylyltransferase n=1 Tax=Thermotoga neapolitana TaxID=2337 RepID=UPI00030C8119|nr:mannose-1-phosphate guanylyltransferase [Thermotoga neapolitana]KFZ21324.1 mannose-1-phosphate guanylyltransferase [Thermotoga neapolitana LA10]HBF10226.1 mannose-1-phosphate guanylyltransferase [Thermotoga neapolitana]
MKALILAGGSGERFWPFSTPETPKQFLKLFGDKSLIRWTFERVLKRLDPKDVIVVTHRDYVERTKEELPELPPENIIAEPLKKNTAPACFVGTKLAEDDEPVLVLPADHRISDVEKFWETMEKALDAVEKYGGLFTFGIVPTRPETGYGYIEVGKELEDGVHEVAQFREKPDLETAKRFLESGRFLWNSGMFLWKAKEFIEEVKVCEPAIYEHLKDVDPRDFEAMKKAYEKVPSISVDYAVMERSKKVRVVKADFEWSDVGNWSSVREIEGYTEESENVVLVDSERVFVKPHDKPIAIVGLSDVIVIDTPNGILICKEEHAQKVREVVRKLFRTS